MAIFVKKKIVKDRRAGLVFLWRGAGHRNIMGYALGLLCAAVLVFLLLYGVKIETPSFEMEERARVHKLVLMGEKDPNISHLSNLEAPFQRGWDPLNDEAFNQHIVTLTRMGMLRYEGRSPQLKGVEEKQKVMVLPYLRPERGFLPDFPSAMPVKEQKVGDCQLVLNFGEPKLATRLMVDSAEEAPQIRWNLRGKISNFVIGVSRAGEVLQCTPLGELGLPMAEAYVRNLKFKPLNEGTSIQMSKLSVSAEEVKR